MRFGYIGLGNIGAPMARRLVGRGASLAVFDAFAAAADPFRGDALVCASPADLGAKADLIGICVRDDADVTAVVDGPDGLLATMTGGGIAIHSTVRPSTVIALAAKASDRGVQLIDAAVTGGAEVASRGDLTTMVGGSEDQIALLRPLMEAYCKAIVHAGAAGAGMTLKLCNNLVTYLELVAALEGYRLAEAAGLPAEQLTQVMTNNGNLTPSMKAYIGFRTAGPGMIGDEAFLATQKALVHLGEKDVALAEEAAAEYGAVIPGASAIRKIFRDTVFEGLQA